ncbi:hypothetical protein AB3N02_23675, partial [Priestia aryabhattai]|uniref:hypothetical protein n=1 Tax=Priestia aryabhattai TaxID=412384 RepID=UPI0039A38E6B
MGIGLLIIRYLFNKSYCFLMHVIYIASLHKVSSGTHQKKEPLSQNGGLHPVCKTGIKAPFKQPFAGIVLVT